MPNEEHKSPNEEGKEPEAQTVSKADYDKLVADNDDLRAGKSKSDKELESSRLELLSPDYISYKEGKGKTHTPTPTGKDIQDLEKMTRKEFLDLIGNGIGNMLGKFKEENLDPLRYSVHDMAAREEVRSCKGKYPDFEEFREDMLALVKLDDSLTIDNAYKIAKSNRKQEKDEAEKAAAAAASAEKPGGPASSSLHNKDFKSKEDAAEDAWTRAVGDSDKL